MAAIHRWFTVLAEELASRLAADEALYRRRPRNLVVHYRCAELSYIRFFWELQICCAL